MIHVEFRYMLGWAPGGITFEKPAFKLTKDVVEVWGGRGSELWRQFEELVADGLMAVQQHGHVVMRNVEMAIACSRHFTFLQVQTRKKVLSQLRHRLKLNQKPKRHQLTRFVNQMIDYAYDNFWTNSYAKFQLLTNGVVP